MKDRLESLIEQFSQLKILVLGDFILDEFVFGEISRISREAPVLILKYRGTNTAPGGGANTVSNVDQLGAEAIPVGFLLVLLQGIAMSFKSLAIILGWYDDEEAAA